MLSKSTQKNKGHLYFCLIFYKFLKELISRFYTFRTFVVLNFIYIYINWPTERQNQTETKYHQRDEILNNHNHHKRSTTDTSSNINTINHLEEKPKNLKHASIRPNGRGGGRREFRSKFSRTCPRDATGSNGHRKLKKRALWSNVKTKLDIFENIANLSENLFSKNEISLLNKILTFVLGLTNITIKTSTKTFLSFFVILNLGHTLDQLKIIQMNLDLEAKAIGYQLSYPTVLKPL